MLTIKDLDTELNTMIAHYSIYGIECTINTLVNIAKQKEVTKDEFMALVEHAYKMEEI